MMIDTMQFEITRELPLSVPARFIEEKDGALLFVAYGCALMERDTGKSYVYKAVNLKTGKSEVLGRRKKPLAEVDFPRAAKRMKSLLVAEEGHFAVDKRQGQSLNIDRLREVLLHIFRVLLPEYGYNLREEQVGLAEHILEVISRRGLSLAEAGVGIGKTHAYLIATALAKRGRLGDFWMRKLYPKLSYVESAHLPVVIATSSIALQKAIVNDYIPEISRILMEHSVITTPLTCVLRKGKEHYLCEMNLRQLLRFENDENVKRHLSTLVDVEAPIDLAAVEGLTPYIRQKICVPDRCDAHCSLRRNCRYLRFLESAKSSDIDFQVCNHQYFLADVLRRTAGQRPLLPPYQAVVIDEAHKFLQAARLMYGVELSYCEVAEIAQEIIDFTAGEDEMSLKAREYAKKLNSQNKRLFRMLDEAIPQIDGDDDDVERFPAVMSRETVRHLRNIRDISNSLRELWSGDAGSGCCDKTCGHILRKLIRIMEQADALAKYDELICWLEKPDIHTTAGKEQEILLCGLPKKLSEKLYAQVWQKEMPIILTSGTLSAGGDFAHIKRTLGLNAIRAGRLMEASKPSPFDYRNNALLYISENIPFPNNRDKHYFDAVTDEIERLIKASHGHAAVLFTSYNALGFVYAELKRRGFPFPLFRLERGNTSAIEQFRQSGNGVLFASGAFWEGIDIPGDALSMLIIVKLPFAVPDPIGEYEQTIYSSMEEYKDRVIVPEMLVKLTQGFGRLIRSETDAGAVALLDSRVSKSGAYRDRVLQALPSCKVTSDIAMVRSFMEMRKPSAYFK